MQQRQSKTFNIRLQVTVETGSLEDDLLEYLNNEATRPFGKAQMLMMAIKPFWSTLALLHKQLPQERVVQALKDGRYLWELQEQYLRERIETTKATASGLALHSNLGGTSRVNTFSATPINNAPVDEQLMATDSPISYEVIPPAIEVVEDEAAAEKSRPFNPFGDEVIFTN